MGRLTGQPAGGKFLAGLRGSGETPEEATVRAAEEFTEAGLVKRSRQIQVRTCEKARDREFRPVRPPLAGKMLDERAFSPTVRRSPAIVV